MSKVTEKINNFLNEAKEKVYYATWDSKDRKNASKFAKEVTDFASNVYLNIVQRQIEVHLEVAREQLNQVKNLVKKFGGILRGETGKRVPTK